MSDTLTVFLKEFFEKVDFEKKRQTTKKHERLPKRQRVNLNVSHGLLFIVPRSLIFHICIPCR